MMVTVVARGHPAPRPLQQNQALLRACGVQREDSLAGAALGVGGEEGGDC